MPNYDLQRPPPLTPEQKRAIVEISKRTGALLKQLAARIPADQPSAMQQVHFGGEWDVMMNFLVASFDKDEIPISPSEFAEVRDVLYLFPDLEPRDYIYDREAVLARLTVID